MTCSSSKREKRFCDLAEAHCGEDAPEAPGLSSDEARDGPGWAALAEAMGQLPWSSVLLASVAAL